MTDQHEINTIIYTIRAKLEELEGLVKASQQGEEGKPKPKAKAKAKAKPKAKPEGVEAKPRPALTEEHKAKMAAGRKAAAELRKAEGGEAKPKPKAKAKPEGVEAKPRPPLTEEHKAKMATARKAAAERRKAEKAIGDLTIEIPPSPPVSDLDAEAEELKGLVPLSNKGHRYLRNTETNACYKRTAEGTKGVWAGVYNPAKKEIDDSMEEPKA